MKSRGLLLVIGLAFPAYAQTSPIELVCDGTLSRPHNELEVELSGVLLRVSNRVISINGGVFDGDYPITSNDETYVSISSDSYVGGINRFSGKFYIVRNGPQPNTWTWQFSSTCTKTKPLF